MQILTCEMSRSITRHSQRTLLIIWVIGALISIKLGSAVFSGKLEPIESYPSSASPHAKGEKHLEHTPQPGKFGWKKFLESIKRGRDVPACSDAQRSLNQCK
jgi:hypothetical protein